MRDFDYFANFIASQCKQTPVCLHKVVIRQEDRFPRICEGLCHWLKPERLPLAKAGMLEEDTYETFL